MKRLLTIFTLLCAVVLMTTAAWGQLASWEVSGLTNSGGSPQAPNGSVTTNSNITVGGLNRNSISATSTSSVWGGASFDGSTGTPGTQVQSISDSKYITFAITANTGYQVSFTSIGVWTWRRSGTGPNTALWQYQVGTGSFTDIGASFSNTTTTTPYPTESAVDVSGISDLQNVAAGTTVTFRLLLWGATGSTGTFYISNQTGDDFTINGTVDAPLPVELTSFIATGARNGASLVWKTATEKNNYGFNIERRAIDNQNPSIASPNRGGLGWGCIGFVSGHGTSNTSNSYSYMDANVAAGTYAYRIAQIDNDGTVKTYNESEVTVGASAKVLSLNNYPNPFNPTTTIEFTVPSDGMTTVKIYNILGQEILTAFSGDVKAGQYQHATFEGSKLSSGVYFYSIENNGQRMVKKMLMMK